VQTAPVFEGCANGWTAYGGTTLPSNQSFDVTGWKKISVAGSEGLENVRVMIAQGVPLAYGTSLYTDFRHYDGTPNPYVGNGDIRINPTTNKPVGHVMMRPCHMWTPPFGKGFYERSCKTVGCSHMSGLCARLLWPLALMISAD
jgi:hypothetical protein